MKKERADELVYRQGLAESREKAKRLIMAGQVAFAPDPNVATKRPILKVDKAGHKYSIETRFILIGIDPFVGRGAYKLLTALNFFKIDVKGFICLDAGASTGGFTDCLLQHGAARVYAVDVGKDQLHERLRSDSRVISMEGINLRLAPKNLLPEKVDLIVADISFISLKLVLPPCLQWLKSEGQIVTLIKPQFEVGPHQTDKGVVRDPVLRQQAVDNIIYFCQKTLFLHCVGVVPSDIKGPKGNQEYLAWFQQKNIS